MLHYFTCTSRCREAALTSIDRVSMESRTLRFPSNAKPAVVSWSSRTPRCTTVVVLLSITYSIQPSVMTFFFFL